MAGVCGILLGNWPVTFSDCQWLRVLTVLAENSGFIAVLRYV
jgi:hypothetical protein